LATWCQEILVTSFEVRNAGIEHEPVSNEDAFSVGVDDGKPGGRSVLFMCMVEEGEFDSGLGLDTYCITVESGALCYGGVKEVRLTRSLLELSCSPFVCEKLGLDDVQVLAFELQITDIAFEELRSGLRRVFSYGKLDERPRLVGL
jgi:immunity protein 10 of polymorphic toxin system